VLLCFLLFYPLHFLLCVEMLLFFTGLHPCLYTSYIVKNPCQHFVGGTIENHFDWLIVDWLIHFISSVLHLIAIVIACDWLQVEKAESVLLEIKRLIDEQKMAPSGPFEADVKRLSDEFYEFLPHKNDLRVTISSKQLIATKQQLCQVICNVSSLVTLLLLFIFRLKVYCC